MDLPDWIDEDIIANPAYWIITIGAELAILLGFKAQKVWGGDMISVGMSPIAFTLIKLSAVVLIPVISFFIVKKLS